MSSTRKRAPGEEKRACHRSPPESLTGSPQPLGEDSDAIRGDCSLAGNNAVFRLTPEAAGGIHALLMLESHGADGLHAVGSLRGGLRTWLSLCSCCVFLAPVLPLLAESLCEKHRGLWV